MNARIHDALPAPDPNRITRTMTDIRKPAERYPGPRVHMLQGNVVTRDCRTVACLAGWHALASMDKRRVGFDANRARPLNSIIAYAGEAARGTASDLERVLTRWSLVAQHQHQRFQQA